MEVTLTNLWMRPLLGSTFPMCWVITSNTMKKLLSRRNPNLFLKNDKIFLLDIDFID
jgi:hypothetical protein